MHQIRRIGLTYYARFSIPKDRWEDCKKREVLRTLQTRDLREARKRRPAAIAAIRQALNQDLEGRGLPPLDSDWVPDWHSEALKARAEITSASDEPRWYDDEGQEGPSDRDLKRSHVFEIARDLEETHDSRSVRQFLDVALGDVTPIRTTADRWLRDVQGRLTEHTRRQHGRALDLLGEFLARGSGAEDGTTALKTTGMEEVQRRRAAEFMEWLEQDKGLRPKTLMRLHSALSTFWQWAEGRGLLKDNPWKGLSRGLKEKDRKRLRNGARKRPYTPDELVRLLRADPNAGRKWSYGAAIFDVMRLSLLTGARANEVCSLRRCDVTREGFVKATHARYGRT